MIEDTIFSEKPIVLIVDDTPEILSVMTNLLKDKYRVKIANNGKMALKVAMLSSPPDLILLDIMMPEMDGYDVCRHFKEHPATKDIPVLFLTSKTDLEDEMKSFELGAVDYIIKPISPPVVLARINTHVQLKRARDYLKDQNTILEIEVQKRTNEVVAIQEATIYAMASIAETRDSDTGYHIRRTQLYVRSLAEKLRNHPRFTDMLDNDQKIDLLFKSAALHDLGKVGIPDYILLKPGRLTPEEYEIMKTHSMYGRDAILAAEKRLGLALPFLSYAKEIAYSHHEKWNGTGYPEGLSGDDIPVSGRLMAVADVYDALVCHRVYKKEMTHEQAVEIISKDSGTHFDPDIVNAFNEIAEEFRNIANRFRDMPPPL